MRIFKRTIMNGIMISLSIIITNIFAVDKVIVNHTNWDPSDIDIATLDIVRNKKIIFIHVSVGSNIAGGLRNLRDENPTRYDLTINHAPVNPDRLNYPAFGHEHFKYLDGYNAGTDDKTTPKTKAFDNLMRSHDGNGMEWGKVLDIAYFKFCWVDIRRYDYVNAENIFDYYISTLKELINDYPICTFVHFTCPIKGDMSSDNEKRDNIKRHQYNELIRAYVDTAGGFLFDIADIEAYDNNNVYQSFEFQGKTYPKMWYVPENSQNDGWSDDGGHLNAQGKERMALAMWKLWATTVKPILPVELVSFKGHAIDDGGIELIWGTASENNNYGFEIERSTNQKHFKRIAFINGQGTTTIPNHYRFFDKDAITGQYYYRLKQLDFDGSYEYSSTIKISITLPGEFRLYQNYPNPFNSSTKISYILPINSPVELTIYNVNGQAIYQKKDDFQRAGYHSITWDAINLIDNPVASGLYYYTIKTQDHSICRSMIYLK